MEKSVDCIDLSAACKVLSKSKIFQHLLKDEVGREDYSAALKLLKAGNLDGDLGATLHDLLTDTIRNDANIVWSGLIEQPHDEYPVQVYCYEGIYWVWAMEYDPVGYFLDKEEAISYIHLNWEGVMEDDEELGDDEEELEAEPDWDGAYKAVDAYLKSKISAKTTDEELQVIVDEAVNLSDDMGVHGANREVLVKMAEEVRSES